MRFFTFLIATCVIIITANGTSTEKHQLNSTPDIICKNALEQGINNVKEAKKMLEKADTALFSSALLREQEKAMIENYRLATENCCVLNPSSINSNESIELIKTTFNNEHRNIQSYIKSRNPLINGGSANGSFTRTLQAEDMKLHYCAITKGLSQPKKRVD